MTRRVGHHNRGDSSAECEWRDEGEAQRARGNKYENFIKDESLVSLISRQHIHDTICLVIIVLENYNL